MTGSERRPKLAHQCVMMLGFAFMCSTAPAATSQAAALHVIVSDPAHTTAPGCAVGVFHNGKMTSATFAGYADITTRHPIDGDTLFYAASISKQFTALAIAQLAVAGKLRFSDDVSQYLPELPQYRVPITIAMLLHHTSGVRDDLTLMRLAGLDPTQANGRQEALQLMFRQKDTNFTPGTAFLYSNGGYLLLAEIVARVSGEPFASYVQSHILDPLGMRESYILHGAAPERGNVAHGYVPDGHGFTARDTYPRFGGSGGLMLSLHDLARYEHDIVHGHRVWTPAIHKLMLAPGRLTDGRPAVYQSLNMRYAAGLEVGLRDGQFFVQHGGGAEGFKHEFARLPRVGLAVAVLCNRGDWNALEKADAVINVVQPNLLRAPTPQLLRGAYRSPAFASTYVLTPAGASGIAVTIHPDGSHATSHMSLTRSRTAGHSNDGSYAGQHTRLVPDPDGNGFTLETKRASGMSFRRVTAGTDHASKERAATETHEGTPMAARVHGAVGATH